MSDSALPITGAVAAPRQGKKVPKKAEALVLPLFRAGGEAPAEAEVDSDGDREEAGKAPVTAAGGTVELPAPEFLGSETLEALLARIEAVGATGAAGEVTRIAAPTEGEAGHDAALPATVIAVGLGSADELDDEVLRRATGTVARTLTAVEPEFSAVATTLGDFGLRAAVEGWLLGSYRYTGFKAAGAKAPGVTFVADWKDAKKEFVAGQVTAESTNLVRDLVNTPANHLYPAVYADILAATAEEYGVKADVLDAKALRKQGFGGVLAVGQGSAREPRVVELRWKPKKKKKSTPKLALVGKGITFDTGGISLKPAKTMEDMISDMGGSAAAAAAVFAAARLNLDVEVTATVALAENMPSGSATRPGDVITHYGGITSEIINTDAEGRVVLADAITRAAEGEPDYLVETSTLTGAQIVALGNRTAGVMGTEELRDRFAALGREIGENAWAMPLLEEHEETVVSPVADIRNSPNSRDGGMLYAAMYLSQFVPEGLEWAHVDVAGPSYNTGAARGYTPKRATGTPVRTFIALAEELAAR